MKWDGDGRRIVIHIDVGGISSESLHVVVFGQLEEFTFLDGTSLTLIENDTFAQARPLQCLLRQGSYQLKCAVPCDIDNIDEHLAQMAFESSDSQTLLYQSPWIQIMWVLESKALSFACGTNDEEEFIVIKGEPDVAWRLSRDLCALWHVDNCFRCSPGKPQEVLFSGLVWLTQDGSGFRLCWGSQSDFASTPLHLA